MRATDPDRVRVKPSGPCGACGADAPACRSVRWLRGDPCCPRCKHPDERSE